jgi:replicative DNA helicase
VVSAISTEDFFKDSHRAIFAAMRRLAEESREIDLLTIKEELTKRAQLEQVGGSAYISSLVDGIPDIANVERYAHIVKEKSTLRRLIMMGNSVMRAASRATCSPSPRSPSTRSRKARSRRDSSLSTASRARTCRPSSSSSTPAS